MSNSGVTRIKQGTWSGFLPARAVVMIPRRSESAQLVEERSPVRAIFCFEGDDQPAVRSLVERMIEALGLGLHQACLTSPEGWSAAIQAHRAELAVAFGQAAASTLVSLAESAPIGQWSVGNFGNDRAGLPILITHDAKEVLGQPALKRPVWEHLKQVSQKLGVVPKSGR